MDPASEHDFFLQQKTIRTSNRKRIEWKRDSNSLDYTDNASLGIWKTNRIWYLRRLYYESYLQRTLIGCSITLLLRDLEGYLGMAPRTIFLNMYAGVSISRGDGSTYDGMMVVYVRNSLYVSTFYVTYIGFKSVPLKLKSMTYIYWAYVD
jgi:hypothetical protein